MKGWFVAAVAITSVSVPIAACGTFLAAPDDGATDAGLDANATTADAGVDATASDGGPLRTPGITMRCGAGLCSLDAGQACCADSEERSCRLANELFDAGGCPGTEIQCQGSVDCPTQAPLCCHQGGSIGSKCLADCGSEPQYCYAKDDCASTECCIPLPKAPNELSYCGPCR